MTRTPSARPSNIQEPGPEVRPRGQAELKRVISLSRVSVSGLSLRRFTRTGNRQQHMLLINAQCGCEGLIIRYTHPPGLSNRQNCQVISGIAVRTASACVQPPVPSPCGQSRLSPRRMMGTETLAARRTWTSTPTIHPPPGRGATDRPVDRDSGVRNRTPEPSPVVSFATTEIPPFPATPIPHVRFRLDL